MYLFFVVFHARRVLKNNKAPLHETQHCGNVSDRSIVLPAMNRSAPNADKRNNRPTNIPNNTLANNQHLMKSFFNIYVLLSLCILSQCFHVWVLYWWRRSYRTLMANVIRRSYVKCNVTEEQKRSPFLSCLHGWFYRVIGVRAGGKRGWRQSRLRCNVSGGSQNARQFSDGADGGRVEHLPISQSRGLQMRLFLYGSPEVGGLVEDSTIFEVYGSLMVLMCVCVFVYVYVRVCVCFGCHVPCACLVQWWWCTDSRSKGKACFSGRNEFFSNVPIYLLIIRCVWN